MAQSPRLSACGRPRFTRNLAYGGLSDTRVDRPYLTLLREVGAASWLTALQAVRPYALELSQFANDFVAVRLEPFLYLHEVFAEVVCLLLLFGGFDSVVAGDLRMLADI